MGRTHADAAHRLDSTRLVAVAGGRRAAQLAADYGVDEVATTAELIRRDDIDAIVISTPHHCHVEEALLAADCGKHALIEKPLATTVDDAVRMRTALADRGLTLAVGYHQRFRESNKTVRRLIQDGAIGAVRCIQSSALFDIDTMRGDSGFGGDWSWWKDPRSIAHLLNSAPHNIDLCRWWLGSEVVTAAALSGTYRETDNPNENTTMALLSFDDGAMCTYWSSSVVADPGFAGEDFRFRVMGDEGLLDFNPFDKIQMARGGEWETVYEQPPVGFDDSNAAYGLSRMQAYCDQMQGFVDAVGGAVGGAGNADDGVVGVACVIAMLESSRTGQTVRIDDLLP